MTRPSFDPRSEAGSTSLGAGELQEIGRLLQRLTEIVESHQGQSTRQEVLTKRARQAFIDRRKRIAIFEADMFGELAWDILLILYIEREGRRHSIAQLAQVCGASPSSTLRWVRVLESRDLICRTQHPTDLRAAFVELSEKGIRAMNSYFSETLTAVR